MARPASDRIPERLCIGCRGRSTKSGLVRLVWDRAAQCLAVDPGGSAPGRGAWVHPDPGCCDLALRRRAVGRALRVADVDGAQVARVLGTVASSGQHVPSGQV